MWHRIEWWFGRVRQTLWVRPLLYAALAVAALLAAAAADYFVPADFVPRIDSETLEDLLAIIASSMLSVATLAVASMVAAYASASATATPRAFSLVIADDVSQTALSGFIGAFIFSIAALTAVKTGSYGRVGLFLIFALTILIFAIVIMLFLRWVDRIARLGRLGNTIGRVEQAARQSLEARRRLPALGGVRLDANDERDRPIGAAAIGYVQSINLGALQRCAEQRKAKIVICALPGTFVGPGRAVFEEDPRFGLVTMSEIASRALSPAVDDPGTAIDIIGRFVRLFACWSAAAPETPSIFDRVLVPELSIDDMFDDAFTGIGRDGAGAIEVATRLQKALNDLAAIGAPGLTRAAMRHAAIANARAQQALVLPDEKEQIRVLAGRVGRYGTMRLHP